MRDAAADSSQSVEALQAVVDNTVAQLQGQGLLSGETLGQIFQSVSNMLNGQSDESQKATRQEVCGWHTVGKLHNDMHWKNMSMLTKGTV